MFDDIHEGDIVEIRPNPTGITLVKATKPHRTFHDTGLRIIAWETEQGPIIVPEIVVRVLGS